MQKEGFWQFIEHRRAVCELLGHHNPKVLFSFLWRAGQSATKVIRDSRHLLSQALTVEEGEAGVNEYNKDDELKWKYGTLIWSSEPQAELEMLAEGSSLQSKTKNIFLLWLRGK